MDVNYGSDTAMAWKKHLVNEWYRIQKYLYNLHKIDLPTPAFEIVEKKWGLYMRDVNGKSTIHLSRHLFNNFGWGAVTHVLEHEVAHYIVDRAWNMGNLDTHGEAFVKACKILNVDDRSCSSAKDLLDEDSDFSRKEAIVGKIKKVMALTSSSEKGEAEAALRKAEELMMKHNIASLDTRKSDEYLFRPIGPVMKKMHNYVRDLANLVGEYYFVNHILSYTSHGRYFEFFGTKENLDIAEYIFCCLLNQAERLWLEHSRKLKKEYGGTRGIASKACFIEGLFSGYKKKLSDQEYDRKQRNSVVPSSEALVWNGDPLMAEMYKRQYPNMKMYTFHRNAQGGGFGDGFQKGKNLSLNAGLNAGSQNVSRSRMLTA